MPTEPTYRYVVEILDPQSERQRLEYSGPNENAAKTAMRRLQNRSREWTACKVNLETNEKTPLTL